jgi:hypothetical protein
LQSGQKVILAKSETGPTEKWDAIKKINFSAVASRRKTAAVVNSPFNETHDLCSRQSIKCKLMKLRIAAAVIEHARSRAFCDSGDVPDNDKAYFCAVR